MTQDFSLYDKNIRKGKIMRHTQNKLPRTMDKVTMYRATRTITYRNMAQTFNMVSDEAFFTSKCKAVDRLRRDAEGLPEAERRHGRYKSGDCPVFMDYCVALSVYEEFEGALVFKDQRIYVELFEGKLEDNREDAFFETF